MPTARAGLTVSVVNGKIYAIGGDDATNTLNDVEEYDPTTDIWSTKTVMSTARTNLTSQNVADKIYAIGGCVTGVTPCGTVEEYDPLGDDWTAKTSMPTARYGLASGFVQGKVYVLGGFAPVSFIYAVVESYDPLSDAWSGETSMLTARWGLVADTIDGKLYAIGGQTLFHGGYTGANEEGTVLVGIAEERVPDSKNRLQIQPVPFKNQVHIILNDDIESAEIKIYDPTGILVRSLPIGQASANRISWDRKDELGKRLPAGVYILRLEVLGETMTRKLVVLP
jgi:uncharacterized membrane protein